MDEDTLRREVATFCRLAEYLELFDFSGHASARIRGKDTIFINSRDSVRSDIQLKDIIKVNLKDDAAEEGTKAPSETYIHTSIYRRRPDVFAIAHLHSPALISLSAAGKPFIPVIGRAAVFAEGVPLYDDSRIVTTLQDGESLAEVLGQLRAVILRGHGAVVVAETMKALFLYSLTLETNAEHQLAAYHAGVEPRALREEEIIEGKRMCGPRLTEKAWDYYLTKGGI